jgi:hypothetical protein
MPRYFAEKGVADHARDLFEKAGFKKIEVHWVPARLVKQ